MLVWNKCTASVLRFWAPLFPLLGLVIENLCSFLPKSDLSLLRCLRNPYTFYSFWNVIVASSGPRSWVLSAPTRNLCFIRSLSIHLLLVILNTTQYGWFSIIKSDWNYMGFLLFFFLLLSFRVPTTVPLVFRTLQDFPAGILSTTF